MKIIPSKKTILSSWEKYSLIVVGNIVFFALLYFISYRPHNEENRAGEFLSLAQIEQTKNHDEAALTLYEKVIKDYKGTRSAKVAAEQFEILKNKRIKNNKKIAKPKEQKVDIKKILELEPSLYVAILLAENYEKNGSLKGLIKQKIRKYLRIAVSNDGIKYSKLKSHKAFQNPELKKYLFSLNPVCNMKSDWLYDDLFIKNSGIFTWKDVSIKMKVSQAGNTKTGSLRIPSLKPGERAEVMDFRIKKRDGTVKCEGTVKSNLGKSKFLNQL